MKRLRKWLIGLLVMLPGVCFGQVNGTNTSTFTMTKNATAWWGDVVVAGLSGLTPAQVGLGNVDNVSWTAALKTQYDGYAANVTTLLNNYWNKSTAVSGDNITNLTWTKLDNVPANTTSNQATNTSSDVTFGNVGATNGNFTTLRGEAGNLTGLPAGGNASYSTTGGSTADNLTVVVSAGLIKDSGRALSTVGYGNGTSNLTLGDVNDTINTSNARLGVIGMAFDGSNQTVVVGSMNRLRVVPYNCTIIGWSIWGGASSNATVSVWYNATDIPTVADKISATAPIKLTNEQVNVTGDLTGWGTTLVKDGRLIFNVTACDNNWTAVTLRVRRNP
jgi:hypothetical protein